MDVMTTMFETGEVTGTTEAEEMTGTRDPLFARRGEAAEERRKGGVEESFDKRWASAFQ